MAMAFSRAVSLTLGTIAVSSSIAILSFDIIFAATIPSHLTPNRTYITAIVSSTLQCVTVSLLLYLLYKQVRFRSGAYIQDSAARHNTFLLAGFGGIFGILSSIASAVLLGMVKSDMPIVPHRTVRSSTNILVTSAFSVWAVALLAQALFILSVMIVRRKMLQQQAQPYQRDCEQQACPEMKEGTTKPKTADGSEHGESKLATSPSSSGRSRVDSDTRSFRSSLSQVVRPMNSKTKLIPTTLMSLYRSQSMDSSQQDTRISEEGGFDSWDFSSVDPQSRQALGSTLSAPQRGLLATIPASPTGSVSPSPGFDSALEPPKRRLRSRSYSPITSITEMPKIARTMSPTESSNEAHIHPLFRSDSPTPPPAASAATMVVAAVGGGQMLSERGSIRSLNRMRSGSLPLRRLMSHEPSLDDIRIAMEQEEWKELDLGGDRKMTPPIPDFILHGGPRSSMYGYNARKNSQRAAKLEEDEN